MNTGVNRPFKQPLRRHLVAHLPVVNSHVQEMLQHDVIEPAASPWTSNIVLICKTDGFLRFCVDYRKLNDLAYKLPRIDACFHSLGCAKFFSTLDLRAGYWQTEVHPCDRDKEAFVIRRGSYRFKVLSFGLANAPALFQRLMDLVLSGLIWECDSVYLNDNIFWLVYLDEIFVFSDTLHNIWLAYRRCLIVWRQRSWN